MERVKNYAYPAKRRADLILSLIPQKRKVHENSNEASTKIIPFQNHHKMPILTLNNNTHSDFHNKTTPIVISVSPDAIEQVTQVTENVAQEVTTYLSPAENGSILVDAITVEENSAHLDNLLFFTPQNDPSPIEAIEEVTIEATTTASSPSPNSLIQKDETAAVAAEDKVPAKINKKNRLLGNKYMGIKMQVKDNDTSFIQVEKSERKMLTKTCNHGTTKASKRSFLCGMVTDDIRQDLFLKFWELPSWDEKRAYLNPFVSFRKEAIKRRKEVKNEMRVKRFGYDCLLPTKNNEIFVRVCRDFFLATFNIKHDVFNKWIKDFNSETEETSTSTFSDDDLVLPGASILQTSSQQQAGHCLPMLESKKSRKDKSVEEWLELLPKIPSHYCRKSSTRTYVEPTFNTKADMYREYKRYCDENKKEFVAGEKKFKIVLKENKISIFKPRKDQCDLCWAYHHGTGITVEEYTTHIEKKREAYEVKALAAEMAISDPKVLVVTMDLQGVLLCPLLTISSQYYKQKLSLHNFTIFEKKSKEAHLYVWHEGEGGVTSNEFTTCINHFLELKHLAYDKIVLISDGCGYQNRNKYLTSMLADFSAKHKIEIEQRILERGHTMMEVDAIHSALERHFKPPMYIPSDYISKMREARPKQPFIINYLDHTFFKNYESLCNNFKSIRPGKKTGDPAVADIRALLYKEGNVYYKLRHPENWTPLPQRRTGANIEPGQLYKEKLAIDKTKYKHLKELSQFMHRDYKIFYDALKF